MMKYTELGRLPVEKSGDHDEDSTCAGAKKHHEKKRIENGAINSLHRRHARSRRKASEGLHHRDRKGEEEPRDRVRTRAP